MCFRLSFFLTVTFSITIACLPVGIEELHAQDVAAEVDSSESVIHYTGSAPLHNWTGTSHDVSGTLLLDIDNPQQSRVTLRAPVASFKSGPNRRDQKMREVTEAHQFPQVEFRSTDIRPETWGRSSDGHAGEWTVTGPLTFHGETHPIDASVRVTEDTVRANAQFPVSLKRFGIARPELLWVAPIADTIRIDAQIVGTKEEMAPVASRIREEKSTLTDAQWLASENLRDVTVLEYAGESIGLHTRFRAQEEQDQTEWLLAFYGFAETPTGLAEAQDVHIQADQQSVEPRRVEGSVRELDDGSILEIKRAFLSQSDYKTIAKALTVSATIGSTQVLADWMARRDMRLILDEASTPLGTVSSHQEN